MGNDREGQPSKPSRRSVWTNLVLAAIIMGVVLTILTLIFGNKLGWIPFSEPTPQDATPTSEVETAEVGAPEIDDEVLNHLSADFNTLVALEDFLELERQAWIHILPEYEGEGNAQTHDCFVYDLEGVVSDDCTLRLYDNGESWELILLVVNGEPIPIDYN